MNFEKQLDTPKPEKNEYKKIKPENKTSLKTLKNFWNKIFNSVEKKDSPEATNKVYKDDNGEVYRVGDKLEPNKTFEVNGYTYQTDKCGRTVSAEGTLKLADKDYKRNTDSMDAVGQGDQKKNDDKGHLIGHQFFGSDGKENLVPMDSNLNRGRYEKMENRLAEAVRGGADVKLKVEPVYSGKSNRPKEIRVSYSINGEKTIEVYKNRSEKGK